MVETALVARDDDREREWFSPAADARRLPLSGMKVAGAASQVTVERCGINGGGDAPQPARAVPRRKLPLGTVCFGVQVGLRLNVGAI